MPKCNQVGCKKEATYHAKIPIFGGIAFADVHACSKEHFDEIVKSLEEV
jgi:hypothetical protein